MQMLRPRGLAALLALATVLAACGGGGGDAAGAELADLPTATPDEITGIIAEDPRPAVVNVWASWCGPCRAEAPLLTEAHEAYSDEVLFIGVDVQDSQSAAKAFIEEFSLDFDHFFDPNRAVPSAWGGFGVPITYFVATDGSIVDTHAGILDERTLVAGIDGLLADS
jgi:cytochrome c biogenesis protein CcmG/thiol:disulfide interchange protein DsbE